MPLRVGSVESFEEMPLSKSRTSSWFVVACLLGRIVEDGGKSIKLMITEFGRSSRWLVIVECIFEVALFKPIQPSVYCLFVLTILRFDLGR
jgi:hypothetical protein